jgi:protein O-GlcNAc transferase
LFSLNYTNRTLEYCLEEAREYGRKVGQKASRFTAWRCSAQPERLRVGVVSGDLYNHPVGYFLESVLSQINQTRIELIAYPTHHKEDELTARIRPFFSAWKPLVGLSDEAAANLIHADGVHVLIDLSGHTGRNRLPVFAWKPAPVQVTWLGYFATTGVAEMDYILGDKWLLPDGEAHHFVEKGWRLSGSISCLTPPHEDIKVEKLPALQNQSITFGTLNNSSKMNGRVVACWARILNAIPNSRLYLNMRNLRDNALRKSVIERYAAHGVAENRLILEPTTGRIAAFNSYNRMDIALDPFPYPGGTTSYEALWMGVPVLTMRGDKYISHLGESIMHHAGLPDWIAADEEDYIAKAVAFASDLEHLAKLRAGLRQQVLASPLFDAPRFARNFEHALWEMWQVRERKPQWLE